MIPEAALIWICPLCTARNAWVWRADDLPADGPLVMECEHCSELSEMTKHGAAYRPDWASFSKRVREVAHA